MLGLWPLTRYSYPPQTTMVNGAHSSAFPGYYQLLDNGITQTSQMLCNDVAFKVRCAQMNTLTTDRNQCQSFLHKTKLKAKIKKKGPDYIHFVFFS